jgi:hypothetical protein
MKMKSWTHPGMSRFVAEIVGYGQPGLLIKYFPNIEGPQDRCDSDENGALGKRHSNADWRREHCSENFGLKAHKERQLTSSTKSECACPIRLRESPFVIQEALRAKYLRILILICVPLNRAIQQRY